MTCAWSGHRGCHGPCPCRVSPSSPCLGGVVVETKTGESDPPIARQGAQVLPSPGQRWGGREPAAPLRPGQAWLYRRAHPFPVGSGGLKPEPTLGSVGWRVVALISLCGKGQAPVWSSLTSEPGRWMRPALPPRSPVAAPPRAAGRQALWPGHPPPGRSPRGPGQVLMVSFPLQPESCVVTVKRLSVTLPVLPLLLLAVGLTGALRMSLLSEMSLPPTGEAEVN